MTIVLRISISSSSSSSSTQSKVQPFTRGPVQQSPRFPVGKTVVSGSPSLLLSHTRSSSVAAQIGTAGASRGSPTRTHLHTCTTRNRSTQIFISHQLSHASPAPAYSPHFGGIRRHVPRRRPSRVVEFARLSSRSNIRHCDGQADAHSIRTAIFRTHHNNFRNLPLWQLRFSCGCRYQLCVTGVVNVGLG
jgi:hypothetical protein